MYVCVYVGYVCMYVCMYVYACMYVCRQPWSYSDRLRATGKDCQTKK